MDTQSFVVKPADKSVWDLPVLDASQDAVRRAGVTRHVLFRGASGSGKTTTLLSVVADTVVAGQSFVYLAPDRVRAERVSAPLQAIAPNVPRPARSVVSYAYSVIDTWRSHRADPLGGLELLTGAQEDALLGSVMGELVRPELDRYMSGGKASALLRMEMRNLISTVDRWGLSVADLTHFAQQYDFPLWADAARVLFELETNCHANVRGTLRLRHSQVERMAASLLEKWDVDAAEHQVTADIPLPDVVIVDGLQDMTASTLKLVETMAHCGARIVAASNPDAAVGTYRGAIPQLDLLLGRRLGVEALTLAHCYRGTSHTRGAMRRVTDGITVAGNVSYRYAEAEGGESVPESKHSIALTVAHTEAQLGAHIARILRENYLFHDRQWSEQAVLVRSRAQAATIRRHLRRSSVPVDTSTRAFQFMVEPTTRLLIELIARADSRSNSDTKILLNELVASAFVGVDTVDLHRLLRAYRGLLIEQGTLAPDEDFDLEALLMHLQVNNLLGDGAAGLSDAIREECAQSDELVRLLPTLEKLSRAAMIWEVAQSCCEQRPRQALWDLWVATDVAQEWQQRAIGATSDAQWYDNQLDAVVALFRVADVWEQRNPSDTAMDFASDIQSHELPTDTLLKRAYRHDAVSVVTPSEAAGGHWPVVVIAGAQHEQWPNTVLRNQMLHADTLAELCLLKETGAEPLTWAELTHVRLQRRRVKDDEYRMFAAALGLVDEELHMAVVSNDHSAPSELVERVFGVRPDDRVETVERHEDGTVRYVVAPAPSPLDTVGVVGDLRFWACAPADHDREKSASARQALAMLVHEGIRGAHPKEWGTPGALSSEQAIIGGEKPSISPSAVERIETCPLNWFASKIGAESTPGHSAAMRGTFVHSLAECYHSDPSVSVLELFDAAWPDYSEQVDPMDRNREYEKVKTCVEVLHSYLSSLPPEVERKTAVEQFISQDMGRYIIRGMIDRLEPSGDGFRIVDFKTGKAKKLEEALVDPQLQTYQVALHAKGVTVTEAVLQYLSEKSGTRGNPTGEVHGKGMRTQPALTPEQRADRLNLLEEDIAVMNAARFQAVTSPKCDFCSLYEICPAQNTEEAKKNA